MRVSLNWVERLLGCRALPIADAALLETLTLHVAEIDGLEHCGPELPPEVVVGKVRSCEPHPDAERLRCTTIDVGTGELLPIVCGAPNVSLGQTVVVALPGAQLLVPDGAGGERLLTIKKGKLRGAPSHGMICAEDELGLGSGHDGILVLADELVAGTPVVDTLPGRDRVLIIDNHNINHRPDLWGQLGWAREIAAILGLPAPATPVPEGHSGGSSLKVEVQSPACRFYAGAELRGVDNRPSPEWLQASLQAVGLRPKGLLVDVTNYVMYELGEPMHAFDRRCIDGDRIIVRPAADGEAFSSLDGRQLELCGDDLLIADQRRPLALAGIIGGAASAVQDDTTHIVLEAATFQAAGIRRSRLRSGISTDSGIRFEKSLYPELALLAIGRAIEILRQCCPDCEVLGRFDSGRVASQPRRLRYDPDAVTASTGLQIDAGRQQEFLQALGFVVDGDSVVVPWWRSKDVAESIDLIEEIARLHGYQHIAPEVPRLPAAAPTPNRLRAAEHRCRQLLAGLGWDEVQTYGFCSEAWAELLAWPAAACIRLAHPLSAEMTVLRRSLLPNLASAAGRNRRYFHSVAIYELGTIYGSGLGTEPRQHEGLQLAGVLSPAQSPDSPFYAARDAALRVLAGLGCEEVQLHSLEDCVDLQPGRSAQLRGRGGLVLGRVGELRSEMRRAAELEQASAFFEIELELLIERFGPPAPHAFIEPSRFQAVERDFTFLCPEALSYADLAKVACAAAGTLAVGCELAQPVFRGEGIPAGQKAVSIRLRLQALDRTLQEKELQKLGSRVIGSVEHQTPARLRA